MARLTDFTGGQRQGALTADNIKSVQLQRLLERGGLGRPIVSGGQLGIELMSEALRNLALSKQKQAAQGREDSQQSNLKEALGSRINEGFSINPAPGHPDVEIPPTSERFGQQIPESVGGPLSERIALAREMNTDTQAGLAGQQRPPIANLATSGADRRLQDRGVPLTRPNTMDERIGILSQNKDNLPLAMQMRLQQEAAQQAAAQQAAQNQAQIQNNLAMEAFKFQNQKDLKGIPAARTPVPGVDAPIPQEVLSQKLAILNAKSPEEKQATTNLLTNMAAAGIAPKSPEGQELIKQSLSKSQVTVNTGDKLPFKLEAGFMLKDPKDPAKGVTPIPGGAKDRSSAENAGKTSMLKTAQKAASGISGLVFGEDGELDRTNLLNAQLGMPGTKGRELKQKMEFGIQAITRNETGAAMQDSELANTRARFMPSPADSKEIAELKLEMFQEFIGGTLKLLDPSGRFDAERFQVEMESRSGGGSDGPLTPEEQAELDALRGGG